jgi:predicted PilT family ATPase
LSDFNVTEAALWSEAEFNDKVAYLESAGMDELAQQARDARERGQSGLDEWQRIEEAAGKLSPDELARVGKGPHLLEGSEDQPQQTADEAPQTESHSEEVSE